MTIQKKTIFYIFYFFLILLIFEIILRTAFPNMLYSSKNYIYKEHERYGWTLKENLNYKYYNRYSIKPTIVNTNEDGFRIIKDNELQKGTIFFLGDSVTLGLDVSGDKIFPSIVSNELNYKGFNFGINGFSTDQSYLILKDYIEKYKPEHVIYTFVYNDLEYNFKNYIGDDVKTGKPILDNNLEFVKKKFYQIGKTSKSEKVSLFLNSNFASYRLFALMREYTKFYKQQKSLKFYEDYAKDYQMNSKIKKKELEFLFKILNKMKNLCEENNSQFYVVKAFSLDSAKYATIKKKPSTFFQYENYNNYINMKSKENNINLVGVDNFENLDLNKNNFFFNFRDIIYDGHYNELGHAYMAKTILSAINK